MSVSGTSPIAGDRNQLPAPAAASGSASDRDVPGSVPTRVAIIFAILAIGLEMGSLVFYAAAAGFATTLSVQPLVLLASGSGGARLIEWGSIVDMLGYLCIAPVVVYLRDRYSSANLINLYALAGVALVVIGSIGAVAMSTAAPFLIDQYSSSSPGARQSIVPVFAALYRAVVVGMWQTLETIPAAVWLIGTAIAIRGRGSRAVFWIMLVFGLACAAIAAYRLTGL